MDRKQYLELSYQSSLLPAGLHGIRQNVPDEQRLMYGGCEYYADGYELRYDKGKIRHVAILHDISASSIVYAPLEKVIPKYEDNDPKS